MRREPTYSLPIIEFGTVRSQFNPVRVTVNSFFGLIVRVLDSLISAPSNSPALEIEAELHGCEV
jgi:hypothetical protein